MDLAQPRLGHDPLDGASSQMADFAAQFSAFCGQHFADYPQMHAFSAREYRSFWQFFLQWCGDVGIHGDPQPVCVGDQCEHARFFPRLQLNYADALLNPRIAPDSAAALTQVHGDGSRVRFTRGQLREQVARLAQALSSLGVGPGDRVVAVMRNDARAAVSALAVAAVGATFSSVSPELGVDAMHDRFAPLSPRLLIAHLMPQPFDTGVALPEKMAALMSRLPTLQALIGLDDDVPLGTAAHAVHSFDELVAAACADALAWPLLPFNHPLFIMFSSGTTGKPKCIVHGAGGTLLEHLKEHRLHTDLRPGDRLYFHTSCAWMMWNWQLSALASGVEIVTYDGSISSVDRLWRLVADEGITVFGTSPAYLRLSQEAGLEPGRDFDLGRVRAVLSTGAVLHDGQFQWVREHVKAVPLQSISGGTDIIGCFVLGHPDLPVRPGEAQCKSLALDVRAWKDGAPATGIGELVCANPFPSCPLGFLGDEDGSRFHAAYFAQNPGMWTHGDLIELSSQGDARLHGRCDGMLNVRGIKLAPAEIYRVLGDFAQVRDAMVVERHASPDAAAGAEQEIVALLVMRDGSSLDEALATRIRHELGTRLSPAHVPDRLIAVPDLPYTYNNKASEAAARAAVNRETLTNAAALRNPQCLDAIREHPGLQIPASTSAMAATLAGQLQALWQQHLGLARVNDDDNFFDLGGNSLRAARLLLDVKRLTGRTLPLATLVQAPTLRQLTALIEGGTAAAPSSSMLACMRPGTGLPVFLVHGLSGTVMECWPLIKAMRTPRPLWGLQARGIDGEQPPQARIEDIAASYIEQIRALQPMGPYALLGYSFGGAVVFEMACQLQRIGQPADLVCLLDPYVGQDPTWAVRVHHLRERIARKLGAPAEIPKAVAAWLAQLDSDGKTRRARPSEGLDMPPAQQLVFDCMTAALANYRPPNYDAGPVVFIHAATRLGNYFDPMPVWRRVARGGVHVINVAGSHLELVRSNAAVVAQHLDLFLSGTTPATPTTTPAPGYDLPRPA